LTEKLPDIPYTFEIEGSGGDAIDVGWAVDHDKKPVLIMNSFYPFILVMNAWLAGWRNIDRNYRNQDIEPSFVTEPAQWWSCRTFHRKSRNRRNPEFKCNCHSKWARQEMPQQSGVSIIRN